LPDAHSTNADRGAKGAQTLGGFEIIGKLGQGGMGAVFLARQISMDRQVALKVLPQRLAKNKEFVERFVREAHAAARLSHVNIVQAIDVGHDSGYYYFAMEYVDGSNLRAVLDQHGRLPEANALRTVHQLAVALNYAHTTAGIIHRDVKPENVLITGDGVPKLTDLGLVRGVGRADSSLTKAGVALGTPNYISPEQVRGEADLDGRTDVYSLGATLFHLLTGRPPFEGGTPAEVMAKHLTEPVPDAHSVNPEVSTAAAAICRKAMTKDREQRYPSARAFAEDVETALAGGHPAAVTRPSGRGLGGRTRRAVRHRRANTSPWPYIGGGLAAAAALILLVWLVLSSGPKATGEQASPDVVKAGPILTDRPDSPSAAAPRRVPDESQRTVPDPAPARDRTAELEKAATAAFELLCQAADEFVKAGDYDAAIAELKKVPSEYGAVSETFRSKLIASAKAKAHGLAEEARGKLGGPIAVGQTLLKSSGPAKAELEKGLAGLEAVSTLKFTPLTDEALGLAKRLRERLSQIESSEQAAAVAAATEQGLKQLHARNDELYKTYLAKCDEAKKKDKAKVEAKYGGEWTDLGNKLKAVKGEIDRLQGELRTVRRMEDEARRRLKEVKDRFGRGIRKKFRRYRNNPFDLRRRELEGQLSRARKEEAGLKKRAREVAIAVKGLQEAVDRRDRKRRKQVQGVYQQHRADVAAGKALTGEQMTANYDGALQLK